MNGKRSSHGFGMGVGNLRYVSHRHSRPKELNDHVSVHGRTISQVFLTVLCGN